MRRKISLFLVLCLLVGVISPHIPVYASEQVEEIIREQQIEETTEGIKEDVSIEQVLEVQEKREAVEESISAGSLVISENNLSELEEMIAMEDEAIGTASVELTRADIPDSVLWNYLSSFQGADGVLTTDDMLLISNISIATDRGYVTNLKGIEYAVNLQECSLEDHNITDKGILPLLSCVNLKSINLIHNRLTTMPDFSAMTNLTTLKLSENCIPKEEITEDKYPAGVNTEDFWKQYHPDEIHVKDGIVYKDATESGTYGVALEIISRSWYTEMVGIKITDITEGDNQVLFEDADVNYNDQYFSTDYYSGRMWKVDLSQITAIPGERLWEIVCTLGNVEITKEVSVTVDPDGQGGFQEVPGTILPRELADYWISYPYATYDTNKDGMISFLELANITYFSLGYSEETSLQIDSYAFLPYMKNLRSLSLTGETNFTQEALQSLTSLKELYTVSLSNVGEINDISVLREVPKLQYLYLFGASNVSGLKELKNKEIPLLYVGATEGTFSDADIFDFICNKTEENIPIGTGKILVETSPEMQSVSDMQVSASDEGIVAFKEENPFFIYGIQIGETDVTYTFGESSYTVHVTVTGTPWDSDSELGTVVDSDKRMYFTGTEGVVNARAHHIMVDEEKNIWNISSRTPEKILEKNDYTKYAARLIYRRSYEFSTEMNAGGSSDSLYLDSQGTLWAYNTGYTVHETNFMHRYEIMQDVQDWQESGYSEEAFLGDASAFLLIQKKDGSLWYCDFGHDYEYDSENKYGVSYLYPRNLEKLEDSGVTSVHPRSYVKDGVLYLVDEDGQKIQVAENIVNVWDNTTIVLAQDEEGNYYTTKGKVEVTGTVKEFLMSNCWDYDYLVESEEDSYIFEPTERDMIAGYLLMENGNLYRSIYSRDTFETDFVLADTDVTALEKDYYWKGDVCHWFTGEIYSEYIGDGVGKGLYPVWEKDEITGQESFTLYVHGIPYLTKVADWTVAGECIYAVRLDNTLWQFDDENTPRQVDFSSLSSAKKEVKTRVKEIQILDLQKSKESVQVTWSEVEDAHSYRIYTTYSDNSDTWIMVGNTVTQYMLEPDEQNKCYYRIEAVDKDGEVLASSWKFYTKVEDANVFYEMKFQLSDWNENEILPKEEEYTLTYDSTMKGKKLYLNVVVEGLEEPTLTARSGKTSVVQTKVQGQCVELTLQGSGTTTIKVTETVTGCQKTIYLNLKKYVPPKVKVKLKEKLNLFYKDAKAVYQLTNTSGTISKVEFVPNQGGESFFRVSYQPQTQELELIPKVSESGKSLFDLEKKELAKALKGQLKVTIGETTLTQKVTIATSNQKPQVTLTETSRKVYKFTEESGGEPVYVGTFLEFQPIDKKTNEVLENVSVTLTNCNSSKKGVTIQNFVPETDIGGSQNEYMLVKNSDGKYQFRFVGKSSAKAIVKIQKENWAKPIYVNYKVTVSNGKIKAKLSAFRVALNKNYQGDKKNLTLTANLPYTDFRLGEWEITKMPKGAEDGMGLIVKKENKGLGFLLREEMKENLPKGNYMVKIPITFQFAEGVSYTPQPLYVKVNVIDRELTQKDVKWRGSGTLDVINRDNSEIILQPTFTGINAKLVGADFSETDKAAGMDKKFTLKVEDGKLKVKLRYGVTVSTTEKNRINPILMVDTSSGVQHTLSETPSINVKLTQSKVKVTPVQKIHTMYKSKETTLNQLVNYELSASEGVEIDYMESSTQGFEAYLLEEGIMQLKMTDADKKPGNYVVKVKVYLRQQATNKKPVTMNVKVVVKK